MGKAVIGTLLGISIALMQFVLLLPVWMFLFGPLDNEMIFIPGVFGGIILIMLLLSMILYRQMPLKKSVLGTLIGAGACLIIDTVYFVLAYWNGWL